MAGGRCLNILTHKHFGKFAIPNPCKDNTVSRIRDISIEHDKTRFFRGNVRMGTVKTSLTYPQIHP